MMFGTKWPSMISICSQSASQSMAWRHSAPRTAKSAERMEGAIMGGGGMVNVFCARFNWGHSKRLHEAGQIDSRQVVD